MLLNVGLLLHSQLPHERLLFCQSGLLEPLIELQEVLLELCTVLCGFG